LTIRLLKPPQLWVPRCICTPCTSPKSVTGDTVTFGTRCTRHVRRRYPSRSSVGGARGSQDIILIARGFRIVCGRHTRGSAAAACACAPAFRPERARSKRGKTKVGVTYSIHCNNISYCLMG